MTENICAAAKENVSMKNFIKYFLKFKYQKR
jgi:hypothetical protein